MKITISKIRKSQQCRILHTRCASTIGYRSDRSQSRGFLRTHLIENYNFEVVNFSSTAFCIRADESRDPLQQTHRVSKYSACAFFLILDESIFSMTTYIARIRGGCQQREVGAITANRVREAKALSKSHASIAALSGRATRSRRRRRGRVIRHCSRIDARCFGRAAHGPQFSPPIQVENEGCCPARFETAATPK